MKKNIKTFIKKRLDNKNKPELEALQGKVGTIYKHVKKHIPSAYYVSCNDGIVKFGYNHSTCKCFFGECHDRENLYCYVHNNIIFGRCYSAKCKDKKLELGRIVETEDFNNCEKYHFNTQYLLKDKRFETTLNNALNHRKFIGIKSSYGTGKTYAINHILQQLNKKAKRVLFLCHRQLFSLDIKRRFPEFVSYLDIKDNTELINTDKLIISPESLHRLYSSESKIKGYDLIILDESESVLNQFLSPTVQNDKVINFTSFYDEYIRRADKVIMLDADLGARSKLLSTDTVYLINDYESENKKQINILPYAMHDKMIDSMICDINDNKKIALATLEASYGEYVLQAVQEQLPDKNIIFHRAAGNDSDKELLKDVNVNWKKCDLLIYSPQVSAGIDFSEVHFHKMYGYISSTESPRGFLQMLNRVRHLEDSIVNVLKGKTLSNNQNALLVSIEEVENHVSTIKTISIGEAEQVQSYIIYKRLELLSLQEEFNKNSACWLTSLINICDAKHIKIQFEEVQDVSDNKTQSGSTYTKTSTKIDKLMGVEDITGAEASRINDKKIKTADDKIKINKYFMKVSEIGDSTATDDLIIDYVKHQAKIQRLIYYLDKDLQPHQEYDRVKFDETLARNAVIDSCIDGLKDSMTPDEWVEYMERVHLPHNFKLLFNLQTKNDKYHNIKSVLESIGIVVKKNQKNKKENGRVIKITTDYIVAYDDSVMSAVNAIMKNKKIKTNSKINISSHTKHDKVVKCMFKSSHTDYQNTM